jgi:hypothetical protein
MRERVLGVVTLRLVNYVLGRLCLNLAGLFQRFSVWRRRRAVVSPTCPADKYRDSVVACADVDALLVSGIRIRAVGRASRSWICYSENEVGARIWRMCYLVPAMT